MALFRYGLSGSEFLYEFRDKAKELTSAATADVVTQTKDDLIELLSDNRFSLDSYHLEKAEIAIDSISGTILTGSHDEISSFASSDAIGHSILDANAVEKAKYVSNPSTLNKAGQLASPTQLTSRANAIMTKLGSYEKTVFHSGVKKPFLENIAQGFYQNAGSPHDEIKAYFNETDAAGSKASYDLAIQEIAKGLKPFFKTTDPDQQKEVASLVFLWIRMQIGKEVYANFDTDVGNLKIGAGDFFGNKYTVGNYGAPAGIDDNRRRRYWAITKDEFTTIKTTIDTIGSTNILEQAKDEVKTEIAKKRNAIEKINELTSITYPDPVELGGSLPGFDTKVKALLPDLDTSTTGQHWVASLSGTKSVIRQGKEIGKITGSGGSVSVSLLPVSTLKSKGIDPDTFPGGDAIVEVPYTIDGTSLSRQIAITIPLSKPKNNASAEYAKLQTNINSCLDKVSQSLWTDAIKKLYAGNPKFTSLNDDQQKAFLERVAQMAGSTTTINGFVMPISGVHHKMHALAAGPDTVATSFLGLRKKLKNERKNLHGQDSHTPWTEVLKTMKKSLGIDETENFDATKVDPVKSMIDPKLFTDGLSTQLIHANIPGELDSIVSHFRDEEIANKTPRYTNNSTEYQEVHKHVFVSQYEQAQKEAFYTFLKSQKRTIGRKQTTVYDYLVDQARLKNSKGKGFKDTAYLDDLFYRTIGHSTIDESTGTRTIKMRTGGVALPVTVIGTHIPPTTSTHVINDSHAMLQKMLINKFLDKKDEASFDQAVKDFFANGDNVKQRLGGEVAATYPAIGAGVNSNINQYLAHLQGHLTYNPTGTTSNNNALIHKTRDADGNIQDRTLDISVVNGADIIRDDLVAKLEKESGNINIDANIVSKYFYKIRDRSVSLGSSESASRVKAKRIAKKLLKKKALLHGGSNRNVRELLKKCGLTEIDRRDLLNKIEEASDRAKYEERIAQAMPPEIAFSAIRKESLGLSNIAKDEMYGLFSEYVLGKNTNMSWVKVGRDVKKNENQDTQRLEIQARLAHLIDRDLKNVRNSSGKRDMTLIAGNLMKLFDAKKEEIQLLRAIKDGDIKDGSDLKAKMDLYRRAHGTYPQTLIDAGTSKAGVFEWSDEFFEQAKIQAVEFLHDWSPTKAKHILRVDNITVTMYRDTAPAGETMRNKASRLAGNSLDIWLARNPKKGLLGYAAIKSLMMGSLGLLGVTGGLAGAIIPAAVFAGIYAGFKQKGMKKEDLGEVMRLIQQLKDPGQRSEILDKHGLGDTDLAEFMYETDQVAAKLHEFAYKDGFDDEDDATDALKEIGNFMAGHAISQLHGIRMFGGISEANYGRCMKDTYAVAEKYRRRRSRLSGPEKVDPEVVPIAITGANKDQQINAILRGSCGKVFKELEGQAKIDHDEKFAPVNAMINKSAWTHGAIAGVLGGIMGGVGYGIVQAFTDTAGGSISGTGANTVPGTGSTVIPGTPSTTINQTAIDLAQYFGNDVSKAEQFTDLVNNKKMLLSDARTRLGVTDINDQNGILIKLQESYGLNFDKNLVGLTARNAPEYRARLQAYGYGPVLTQLNINDGPALRSFLNGGYPSGQSDIVKGGRLQLAAHFDPDPQPHTFNVVSTTIPGTPGSVINTPGTALGGGVVDGSIPSGPAGSSSGMRHVFFKDWLEDHLANPNNNNTQSRRSGLKSEVSDIFGGGTVHDKVADDFLVRVMDGQTMDQAIRDLGLPGAKYDELVLKIGQDSGWVRSVLDQRLFLDSSGLPTSFAESVYDKILASHPNLLQGPNGLYSVNDMTTLIQQYMAGQQTSNPVVQRLLGTVMDHGYGSRADLMTHMLDGSSFWQGIGTIPHVNMADPIKNMTAVGLGTFTAGTAKGIYDEFTKRKGLQGEQSSISNAA